jgi:hypothetical protein
MLAVRDQEPVQTLGPNGPAEALRHRVRCWRSSRGSHHLQAGAAKDRVEPARALSSCRSAWRASTRARWAAPTIARSPRSASRRRARQWVHRDAALSARDVDDGPRTLSCGGRAGNRHVRAEVAARPRAPRRGDRDWCAATRGARTEPSTRRLRVVQRRRNSSIHSTILSVGCAGCGVSLHRRAIQAQPERYAVAFGLRKQHPPNGKGADGSSTAVGCSSGIVVNDGRRLDHPFFFMMRRSNSGGISFCGAQVASRWAGH